MSKIYIEMTKSIELQVEYYKKKFNFAALYH
jgi:hypothetical protein